MYSSFKALLFFVVGIVCSSCCFASSGSIKGCSLVSALQEGSAGPVEVYFCENKNRKLYSFFTSQHYWRFFEHVSFNYGKTIKFQNGLELTFGLCNGISLFPKCFIFNEYLRIGILEFHLYLFSLAFNFCRGLCYTAKGRLKMDHFFNNMFLWSVLGSLFLVSVEFASFVRINFFSVGKIVTWLSNMSYFKIFGQNCDFISIKAGPDGIYSSILYCILFPQFEIDIANFIFVFF